MKLNQITIKNIISYIQGNLRYFIFYSSYDFLMRKHIKEQIRWRITMMDKRCYDNGSCILCGCKTTGLQMANKACDKPCYPPMMNKKQWGVLNRNGKVSFCKDNSYWGIIREIKELNDSNKVTYKVYQNNELKNSVYVKNKMGK